MARGYQAALSDQVKTLPSHAAPLYSDPPLQYRDSWIVNIPFQTDPRVVEQLVPAPLKPNSDGYMLLGINRLHALSLGSYNEAVVSIPCRFDLSRPSTADGSARVTRRRDISGQYVAYHPVFGCVAAPTQAQESLAGQYIAYIYVDQDAPLAAGREIWGFPKKEARITVEEQDESVTVTVERQGKVLIKTAVRQAGQGNPAELQDFKRRLDTWFNLKLVPSVAKGMQQPDVAQLTATTMQNLTIKQVFSGSATLEFGTSAADPLHTIQVRKVDPGLYINADGDLPYGRVIYDYL